SQLAAEERHPLDDSSVRQPSGVEVAEGRTIDQREEMLLRVLIVADHVDVARRTVEQRPIEHLPPDVLERADEPRRREAPLQFLCAAHVRGQDEVVVAIVEGIGDVDEELASEGRSMRLERIEQTVAPETRRQTDGGGW